MDKLHIRVPIIVEGRYDRAKLAEVTDAPVFTTDGFGIFSQPEKRAMFRKLGAGGIIVLCDSDGAGSVIRGHLRSVLPAERVYNLYTPQIAGKERRKKQPSKAGYLGVEGMDSAILYDLLARFLEKHPECAGIATGGTAPAEKEPITKTDLYFWQLTGNKNAAERRDRFAARVGLPSGMTPNAFLAAIEILYTKAEVEDIVHALD